MADSTPNLARPRTRETRRGDGARARNHLDATLARLIKPLPVIAGLLLSGCGGDQIDMVVAAVRSDTGLLGNRVCRFLLKVKNNTANRLEHFEYSLRFAGLAAPARGGTGIPYLSPVSLSSDSEGEFLATWHEGPCAAQHHERPSLTIDSCRIDALSERDCKGLFVLRWDIARPATAAASEQPSGSKQPFTAAALRNLNCNQLSVLNSKLKIVSEEAQRDTGRKYTIEMTVDQPTGKFVLRRNGSQELEGTITNGFIVPAKAEYSINIADAQFTSVGIHRYKRSAIDADNPALSIKREVSDPVMHTVGECEFRAILVHEEWYEYLKPLPRFIDYVWYPDLKLPVYTLYRQDAPHVVKSIQAVR